MTSPISVEFFEDDIGTAPTTAIKPISTKGLILAPATPDLPDYSHWLNDPEVVRYSELRHRQHTAESCREYISSFDGNLNMMWAINVLGANMHIGNITAHIDPHNNVAQMGILIGEKWAWGRKYGFEAWGGVLSFLKEQKVFRAEAGCMQPNSGMVRLAERAGMERNAVIPSHFLLNGQRVHKMIYGKALAS